MAELFGFSFRDREKKAKNAPSPIAPTNEDGATSLSLVVTMVSMSILTATSRPNMTWLRSIASWRCIQKLILPLRILFKRQSLLIRTIHLYKSKLSNLEVSDSVKNLIRTEFDYIKRLIGFDTKAHEMFRRWYIDGRLYYHKVIDLNRPQDGILELRYVDPQKIKKVRQINKSPQNTEEFMKLDFGKIDEYFLYNPKGLNNTSANTGIRIAKDAISYVTSGIMDTNRNIVLSYLHKAIKVLNQLQMIEDSLVIYRISRAPERRIFYIDVGNLPKVKAEQYLREVMSRYRNKLVYDANTGEIRDDRKYMSMMEDF